MVYPTLIFWSNTLAIILLLVSFFVILRTRKYTKESLGNAVNGISFGLLLFLIVLVINELNYINRYFGVYTRAYAPWLSTLVQVLTGNVSLILLTLLAICLLIGGLLIRKNLQEVS